MRTCHLGWEVLLDAYAQDVENDTGEYDEVEADDGGRVWQRWHSRGKVGFVFSDQMTVVDWEQDRRKLRSGPVEQAILNMSGLPKLRNDGISHVSRGRLSMSSMPQVQIRWSSQPLQQLKGDCDW